MTVGLMLAPNQTLNTSDFKEELAKATGVNAEDIEIGSIKFRVEVTYSFSVTVSLEIARQAIADCHGVSPDNVTIAIDSAARRLTVTTTGAQLTATIQTVSMEVAGQVMAKSADTSAVSEQLALQGVNATAAVKETPRTAVDIQTKVASKTATPVEAPDNTALAQIGNRLGATVSVSGVVKRTIVIPGSTSAPPVTDTTHNTTATQLTTTTQLVTTPTAAPARCSNDIAHGGTESRTMYASSSVDAPAACESESQTRTCSDGRFGTWSGTYSSSTCNATAPTDDTNPIREVPSMSRKWCSPCWYVGLLLLALLHDLGSVVL